MRMRAAAAAAAAAVPCLWHMHAAPACVLLVTTVVAAALRAKPTVLVCLSALCVGSNCQPAGCMPQSCLHASSSVKPALSVASALQRRRVKCNAYHSLQSVISKAASCLANAGMQA